MKRTIITSLFGFSLLVLFCHSLNAQARLSADDDPTDLEPSAMLELDSDRGGLLVPKIILSYDEGDIVAASIPVTPADGLIIFHDGSNDITKGLWYYDAVIPAWTIYSDFSSTLSNQSLDDFGEMHEAQSLGLGTLYELSEVYNTPWASATPGLKGTAFTFLDSDSTFATTETGASMPVDQFLISGVDAIYSVVISATLVSTTTSNTVTGTLFVNDVAVPHLFFRNTFQLKDKPTSLNTSGNLELGPGDKIDFRFISTVKNNGIEVENLNIRLAKLGDL
ncbi:MAG: hypothetical protein ABFS05_03930 [Bacteroidota bacterium]